MAPTSSLRLLHLHSGNMMGGVESVLLTLCDHPNAAPLEHRFGLTFEGPLSGLLADRGVSTTQLGTVRLSRPWTVRQARSQAIELIRTSRPDIVMVHSAWAQAVFGRTVRRTGVPLALYQHDLWTGRPVVEKLARRTCPDLIIANSRFTASTSPSLYPAIEPRIVHCPSALPNRTIGVKEIGRIRTEFSTPENAVVFIQVSRPDPSKGQALLLHSLRLLPADPTWMCWIVGGAQTHVQSAHLKSLRRLSTGHGLDTRVRFLGQRTDVPALMRASDVCCHPTLAPESFGLVLIEAMSAGLPVIASAEGGAAEIVDNRSGVLVTPGDVQALSRAMTDLLKNAAHRRKLGNYGPVRARALCDPNTQIPALHQILSTIRKSVLEMETRQIGV